MANYINHFQKAFEQNKDKNLQAPSEIIEYHQSPNEQSLSEKVKGVAQSGRKIFHHHGQNHAPKPFGHCGGGVKAEKKKKNYVSRMINHMKKKNKVRSIHTDASESSTDSDTDA